jgi:hypothetical protein
MEAFLFISHFCLLFGRFQAQLAQQYPRMRGPIWVLQLILNPNLRLLQKKFDKNLYPVSFLIAGSSIIFLGNLKHTGTTDVKIKPSFLWMDRKDLFFSARYTSLNIYGFTDKMCILLRGNLHILLLTNYFPVPFHSFLPYILSPLTA